MPRTEKPVGGQARASRPGPGLTEPRWLPPALTGVCSHVGGKVCSGQTVPVTGSGRFQNLLQPPLEPTRLSTLFTGTQRSVYRGQERHTAIPGLLPC